MEQDNRESWLNRVALGMAPLFEALDAPLPARVAAICAGIASGAWARSGRMKISKWPSALSRLSQHSPIALPLAPALVKPIATRILAHELAHAAVGIPVGHGKAFKRVALGLGLVGPMRATTPGAAFLAAIVPILDAAGPLPHARLDTDGESTAPKKQKARMLKCECVTCCYTVRTARKWLEEAGAPLCPIEDHGRMEHEPLDEDDDPAPESKGNYKCISL